MTISLCVKSRMPSKWQDKQQSSQGAIVIPVTINKTSSKEPLQGTKSSANQFWLSV